MRTEKKKQIKKKYFLRTIEIRNGNNSLFVCLAE
jgi:hypothetical protein